MNNKFQRSQHCAHGTKVFAGHQRELCKPSELELLRKTAAAAAALRVQMLSVTNDAASRALKAASQAYEADPSEKNFRALREAENVPAAQKKNAGVIAAVKLAIRNESLKCLPILAAMKERAAKIVEKKIAAITAGEEKTAEEIGVPFVPSESIGALYNLLQDVARPVSVHEAAAVFVIAKELCGIVV